jgi:hypothetical protein
MCQARHPLDLLWRGRQLRNDHDYRPSRNALSALSLQRRAATRFRRHLLWLRPAHLAILDELAADDPSDFTWLLHTEGEIESVDERTVRIVMGEASLALRFFEPREVQLTWEREEVPAASAQWGITSWQVLKARTKEKVSGLRFVALLMPGARSERMVFPEVVTTGDGYEMGVPGLPGDPVIAIGRSGEELPLRLVTGR